ncbi:MAG: DUF432 domain-containing protein [Lentisphaeria bacterium]|nr:DUF432 domain-containing protein [Lentisphaeria bacterium]
MIWQETTLNDLEHISGKFGQLNFRVQNYHDEWRVAYELLPLPTEDSSKNFDDVENEEFLNRFVAKVEDPKIKVSPTVPDRPIVIRTRKSISILPKNECVFFLRFPCWVRFSVTSGKVETKICDLPSLLLPKTWYGTVQQGTKCYSSRTRARRKPPTECEPYRIIVPVRMVNMDKTVLEIDHFCIPVSALEIHQTESGTLWGTMGHFEYRGKLFPSRISFSDGFKEFEPNTTLVAKSNNPDLLNKGELVGGILTNSFGIQV